MTLDIIVGGSWATNLWYMAPIFVYFCIRNLWVLKCLTKHVKGKENKTNWYKAVFVYFWVWDRYKIYEKLKHD